jgi:hypothetical protein
MDHKASDGSGQVITGLQARRAAGHMDMGNIVALVIPFPVGVFWFGLSMLIYAFHRHHPNPKVGHYTQWAAYRFYGVVGALVPVATFFPGSSLKLWLAAWAVSAAIVIPSSVWALVKIRRDTWDDTVIPPSTPAHEESHHG